MRTRNRDRTGSSKPVRSWLKSILSSTRVVGWIARGFSVLSISVLLLFLIGETDWSHPLRLLPSEVIGLLLFPGGIVAGMIVGWWREGLGAAIGVGSLLVFYALDWFVTGTPPSGPWFPIFALPGALFGASWLLRGRGRAPR